MESSGTYRLGRPINRRRLIAAGSAGLAVAGAAACGVKGKSAAPSGAGTAGQARAPQGQPQRGGTLNVYYNMNAPLDLHLASGSPHQILAGVYSRVFRFKTNSDPALSLSKDVENDLGVSAETADGVTWTFKLRPDAKFANIAPVNGHPVQAEDVKATFTRALDPKVPNPNRGQLGMIDPAQIQTPDATTVVFKLNYPYAPFNRTLASPNYSLIMPREGLTGSYDLSKVVIGSGPFMVDSIQPDVAYVYKRNPDYFDKTMPNVDVLRLAIVPDASQQLAQFTAGNLDELTLADPFAVDAAKKSNPKATLISAPNGTPNPLFWQLGDPTSAFQDVRVRRALNMAVDRETLGKSIFGGQALSPVFIPPSMGKWSLQVKDLPDATRQYFTYSPGDGKKLLDAAGLSNLQLKLVYPRQPGMPTSDKMTEALSNMLNTAGITNNIVTIDWNKDYIDSGKGVSQGFYPKDEIVYGGFSVYTEADEWLFSYLDSKSVNSHENIKVPALDAMVDKERATLNEDERVKAVLDIQRYLADQAYFLPTVGPYYYAMIQPRVRNYQFTDSAGKHTEIYAKLWLAS